MKNKTELIDIEKLILNEANPRLIKDDRFKKLVKSIKEFPEMLETRPIIANKDLVVLGGNMRLRACIENKLKKVPVIKVNWSKEKQDEFIIKDNVSFGQWDMDLIANNWEVPKLIDWGFEIADEDLPIDEIDEIDNPLYPIVEKYDEKYKALNNCADTIKIKESGPFRIHDHFSIHEVKKIPNNPYKDFKSFGFVRHPVEWVKSRWAWAKASGFEFKLENNESAQKHWLAKCYDREFSEYCKKYIKLCPGECWNTYEDKLGIGTENQVTFIGLYENLIYDLNNFLNKNNIKISDSFFETKKQKVANQGVFKCYTDVMSNKTKFDIMECEYKVIETFYNGNR